MGRLEVLVAIFVPVVLFGYGAQSALVPAPVSPGEIGTAQPAGSMALAFRSLSQGPAVAPEIDESASKGELEALSANATRLLREKYGFCITKR